MSRKGAVPLLVAVGVGVAAGYYQWMPLWDQSEINRLKAEDDKQAADLGPNLIEIPTQSLNRDMQHTDPDPVSPRSPTGKPANG